MEKTQLTLKLASLLPIMWKHNIGHVRPADNSVGVQLKGPEGNAELKSDLM